MPTTRDDDRRLRIQVAGTVQGVGFRPFVWSLATELELAGFVGNDAAGVVVEVEGPMSSLEVFSARLVEGAPRLAIIESVTREVLETTGNKGFSIKLSDRSGSTSALVPPDVATCDTCLAEVSDPSDRRFGYAFVNCTDCGPRFTIVRGIPYDRAYTSMSGFALCELCQREYDDPASRRFHAQPTCCPACGPTLVLTDGSGRPWAGDPIEEAARELRGGAIVAVKGLGGYHLATACGDEAAVGRLRSRKHREERPFAVMVPTLADAQTLCEVSDVEAELLGSPARPIVLMRRRTADGLAPGVAPRTNLLGLMLPYTPLHHLLLAAVGEPLVMTSGNLSDEPIAFDDADARARLSTIADLFLTHDRPIETRVDDSVVRVVSGRPQPVRRSRGYVPAPLSLPVPARRDVLAVGAQLKSTFCLARDRHAFISHHIGDLDTFESFESFVAGVAHMRRLFEIDPVVVAHDLHPDYMSTRFAQDLDGVELVGVQHHHAHIASCMADNGVTEPVIGVAFDGVGYGLDGTAWGGEFLVGDLRDMTRVARLDPMPMPGGDAAVREPWRMAAAHLEAAFAGKPPAGLAIRDRNAEKWDATLAAAGARINAPMTSSAGRLFDAVASLVGIRDEVSYEGQAAIELEQAADPLETGSYAMSSGAGSDGCLTIGTGALIRAIVGDLTDQTPAAVVSARFHNALVSMIRTTCAEQRDSYGLRVVALSGGVFQNKLLVERTVDGLTADGFGVLTHRQVPTNDGGISFGQAAVAAARDRSRS